MAFVTTLFVLTTIGGGETALQLGESKFVEDSKVNSRILVGHVKTTFVPERVTVSSGAGNERLNTMPEAFVPPPEVVPYRVLPDKIKLACGETPSGLFVNVCKV